MDGLEGFAEKYSNEKPEIDLSFVNRLYGFEHYRLTLQLADLEFMQRIINWYSIPFNFEPIFQGQPLDYKPIKSPSE